MTDPNGTIADDAVQLRGRPPRVMRLSRKAIGLASAAAFAVIGGALIYALAPALHKAPDELYDTQSRSTADSLAGAPKDYSQVPKLGPPLPGDLGRPILDAQHRGQIAALPPVGSPTAPAPGPTAADAARTRLAQERDAARGSRVFFGGGTAASGSTLPMIAGGDDPGTTAPPAAETRTDGKRAFLDRPTDRRVASGERLQPLADPNVLQAGSVIAAALVTGIRSDLPGQITAHVTQNVYDSPTGRILLIPQGARLIGDYDADVAFGQRRVLLVWNRLILPDGRSIALDRQPGADARGFAGLEDRTDFHWGGVFTAALVSTLLGIGGEIGAGNDGNLVRALRRGAQNSIGRAGEAVVSRELEVRPTLTIRPGFPVRVIVTRDLVLSPAPVSP